MKKLILLVAISLVIFAGCSDPKIDASSDETMQSSIQKIKDSMSDKERNEFEDALQILAFSQIDLQDIFTQGATGIGNLEGKVKDTLNGMTGEDVITEAERIKEERKGRERTQALEEIKELEAKLESSVNSLDELKKFKVKRSRFYMQEQQFGGPQPVIELSVVNWTGHPVSRAYFEGTIASPGRSVPWFKDTFNYTIPGGLENGEEADWSLAPNMFSEWGKAKSPADAIFTVTVEQLDGPDGKSLFSKRGFDEDDRQRLTNLKKEYGM